jgi:hypothetical protein
MNELKQLEIILGRRNIIYYEMVNSMDRKYKYITKLEIFHGPMWIFHLLRRIALLIDKIADSIRKLIFKMTEIDNMEDKFRFKV